jgi:hypothetical protein
MKKLLFAVVAFSLLATGSSIAEPTHPNEIGIYLTDDGTGPTGVTTTQNTVVPAYLVLTRPTTTETGEPVLSLTGFDLMIHVDPLPASDLFVLRMAFWPGIIDCCPDQFFGDRPYSLIDVSFYPAQPQPVTGQSVVLIEYDFLKLSSAPHAITLEPLPTAAIPGQMSYQPASGDRQIMHPISGAHDAPVFIFNGEAVAVENESFGSVKALYR